PSACAAGISAPTWAATASTPICAVAASTMSRVGVKPGASPDGQRGGRRRHGQGNRRGVGLVRPGAAGGGARSAQQGGGERCPRLRRTGGGDPLLQLDPAPQPRRRVQLP